MTIHDQTTAHIHMDPLVAETSALPRPDRHVRANAAQTAADCIPGAPGSRLRTSIKAGIQTCKNTLECADSNHAATGLRVKTSIKAGIQTCKNTLECADSNHTATGLRVPATA